MSDIAQKYKHWLCVLSVGVDQGMRTLDTEVGHVYTESYGCIEVNGAPLPLKYFKKGLVRAYIDR